MFHEPIINDRTMLTLLLCSKLGSQYDYAAPLTPTEFDMLITRLNEKNIDPVILMEPTSGSLLTDLQVTDENRARIEVLLCRGGTIALALESLTNRGIWVISRLDDVYPSRLLERLGRTAPPLLYGAGNADLLNGGGLAIVGSRDVSESGAEFAGLLARKCAMNGMPVISGGARGVDRIAMNSAFEDNGVVMGILAADLERTAVNRENREAVMSGNLVLATPYNPGSGFSVGNAMGRNKYMYALGNYACVVSSALNKGGTWAGASENLKSSYRIPIFVRHDDDEKLPGNLALIEKGCIPLSTEELNSMKDLQIGLKEKLAESDDSSSAESRIQDDSQMNLFS